MDDDADSALVSRRILGDRGATVLVANSAEAGLASGALTTAHEIGAALGIAWCLGFSLVVTPALMAILPESWLRRNGGERTGFRLVTSTFGPALQENTDGYVDYVDAYGPTTPEHLGYWLIATGGDESGAEIFQIFCGKTEME